MYAGIVFEILHTELKLLLLYVHTPRLKVFHKRHSLKSLISNGSDVCQQDGSSEKSESNMGIRVNF